MPARVMRAFVLVRPLGGAENEPATRDGSQPAHAAAPVVEGGRQQGVMHREGRLFPGQHAMKPISIRQLHRVVVEAAEAADNRLHGVRDQRAKTGAARMAHGGVHDALNSGQPRQGGGHSERANGSEGGDQSLRTIIFPVGRRRSSQWIVWRTSPTSRGR